MPLKTVLLYEFNSSLNTPLLGLRRIHQSREKHMPFSYEPDQLAGLSFLKDRLIRRGDKGIYVTDLQKQLLNAGIKINVDGDFGPATETAVRSFQAENGLVSDGIVGPKTLDVLSDRKVHVKYLSQGDLVRAAKELEIPIAAMLAINEVESKGTGFLPNGLPVILYERHIMYRVLPDYGLDPKDYMLDCPGLVNNRGGGYLGGMREWERLERAKNINLNAALESASWGSYQIMGFHWHLLGFKDVIEYVEYNKISEANQLDCFIRFVKSQPGMLQALRTQDWARFATLYNGKNHKQYDLRIAKAFNRYESLIS